MTNTSSPLADNGRAWLALLLAGAFEIVYALSVAGSEAFTVLSWSISAIVFFLLTLYALSVALKTIDVGIGYAVWAGIGSVGSVVFGSLLFDQSFTLVQGFWLTVIIAGVIWLKLASSEKRQANEPSTSPS